MPELHTVKFQMVGNKDLGHNQCKEDYGPDYETDYIFEIPKRAGNIEIALKS